MAKKVRVHAPSVGDLRGVLGGADFDFGCRPHARREAEGYSVDGVVEDAELERLRAARAPLVRIEVLEEVREPAERLRGAPRGNRFLTEVPRGLGRKE